MKKSKISFYKSPYFSSKHLNYFYIYDILFQKFVNKKIIFVEFGIFEGGSLFFWRDFFGHNARIIGIDMNPDAKKWRKHGFEIYIGDQGSEEFLAKTFKKIGNVDIVLDDGGHRFNQQILTSFFSIQYINDGGLLVVEDTHTSYFKEFGGPSSVSFISWSKIIIDTIHKRFPRLYNKREFGLIEKSVFSVQFYESIVCLFINRNLCVLNKKIDNSGVYSGVKDFRYENSFLGNLIEIKNNISSKIPLTKNFFNFLEKFLKKLILNFLSFSERLKMIKIKKYFYKIK